LSGRGCIANCRRLIEALALAFPRHPPLASLSRRAVHAQHRGMELDQSLAKELIVIVVLALRKEVLQKGLVESRGTVLERFLGSVVPKAVHTERLDIGDGVEGKNATGRLVVRRWDARKAGRHEALDGLALGRVNSQFGHGLPLGQRMKDVASEWIAASSRSVLVSVGGH
jgi:hypothetical protein